uniref:Uncharacterized protein n=1 Tax=Astyanax mexicanus TaxID=7994 RepID=A0A3B1IE83_ASTMX
IIRNMHIIFVYTLDSGLFLYLIDECQSFHSPKLSIFVDCLHYCRLNYFLSLKSLCNHFQLYVNHSFWCGMAHIRESIFFRFLSVRLALSYISKVC